ncbi:MAG: nucleoside-diphosphate kinase [Patescibacteria group bacterium]
MHPKEEKTLVIIKPDGIQRSLVGEIVKRYERSGLKLVSIKMIIADATMIESHYTLDSVWRKNVGEKMIKAYTDQGLIPPNTDPLAVASTVLERLTRFMTSGPLIPMVWQGAHAVSIVRKLTGGTEPLTTDVGTIRGDFTLDSYLLANSDERSVRNVVHASDSPEQAVKEIAHWFLPHEILRYTLAQEKILYDVNLDGIVE